MGIIFGITSKNTKKIGNNNKGWVRPFFWSIISLLLGHPSFVHSTNPKVDDGWFPSVCEMKKYHL
jgi:hypothetical protein